MGHGGHHAVTGTDSALHGNAQALAAQDFILGNEQRAVAAQGDDDCFDTAFHELFCCCGEIGDPAETAAKQTAELGIIGLDHCRARLRTGDQQRCISVHIYFDPVLLEASDPVGENSICRSGRRFAGQNDDVTGFCGRSGFFKHALQHFLADRRARLVDVSIGVTDRIDHLEVRTRILRDPGKITGNAHFLKRVLNITARAAAQNAGGQTVGTQCLEHLGYIDALSARIQTQALNTVDLIHGKTGQNHSLVQRRGQRNGDNHIPSLLFAVI